MDSVGVDWVGGGGGSVLIVLCPQVRSELLNGELCSPAGGRPETTDLKYSREFSQKSVC